MRLILKCYRHLFFLILYINWKLVLLRVWPVFSTVYIKCRTVSLPHSLDLPASPFVVGHQACFSQLRSFKVGGTRGFWQIKVLNFLFYHLLHFGYIWRIWDCEVFVELPGLQYIQCPGGATVVWVAEAPATCNSTNDVLPICACFSLNSIIIGIKMVMAYGRGLKIWNSYCGCI